ncbi:endonuclease/exonuclease/phosphatase family protein [bacterium]|nr:endonuclease/exonuclease/phosphatase family protein [bacterium]
MILLVMIVWIMVSRHYFPIDSRYIALSFFPPYGFAFFVLPLVLIFWILGNRKIAAFSGLVFLAFFLIYGDISFSKVQATETSGSQQEQTVSVIALNVRYYSYGLEKVIAAIQHMDADLYLLSENVLSDEERQLLEESIRPWSFYMGQQEGTAIISRYPVVEFKEIMLPSKQASLSKSNEVSRQHLNPNRSFVHAIINVNGTLLHAISIRFLAGRPADRTLPAALEWGFYVLKMQIQELDFFLNYLKKLQGPVIFGGDLNATPSSIVIQKLSDIAVDSYLEKHIWGGFTFWTQFPSYARLDYLYCMNGIRVLDSVIRDEVVSDHYPVFSRFAIPGNH